MPLSSFNEVSKFGKKKKNLIFFEQAVLRRPRKKYRDIWIVTYLFLLQYYRISLFQPKKVKFKNQDWYFPHCYVNQLVSAFVTMNRIADLKLLRLQKKGCHTCPGCQIFILCEIHYYLCPHIFWVYYFSLSQCEVVLYSYYEKFLTVFTK